MRFVVTVVGKIKDAEIEDVFPVSNVETALDVEISGESPKKYKDVMFPTAKSTELVEYVKVCLNAWC